MFAGSKREILNIKNDNALSMGKIKEIAFIDKNSKEIIRFAQSLIRINSSYSNETAVAFLIHAGEVIAVVLPLVPELVPPLWLVPAEFVLTTPLVFFAASSPG